ncbi:carbohydrate kinase family protein [Pseudobacillus wudalianchiensis]|uniref:Fructokinase n=1 Tax=Pseudobacillus wudalianchiensis TaxID=1743143 RepID=A0A1B9AGB7_9BACI|nr:carbohydrate kinase [Bacillus wudalianchiensis]OCA82879.1 fructokinase [Bacillus wudalianchiensis]
MKTGLMTLGEALIDFIPMDVENNTYIKSPGGAPANVAVGAARLGMTSTFIGKLGKDVLGTFLKETLQEYGVNVSSLILTESYRTGLVFVTLEEDGERSFSFYIKDSADFFLEETEINEDLFIDHKIFHFGTISLLREPARTATEKALFYAKKHGMIISFDPNVRLTLWKDEEALRRTILAMLPKVDVLKLSEEELLFLSGDLKVEVIEQWIREFNLSLVCLTKGAQGSIVFTKSGFVEVEALSVKAIDTTGAGDAFVSALLYCLNERTENISCLTLEEAAEVARFASVSGGLAASQKGAMTALPVLRDVQKIIGENRSVE